MPSTFCHLLFGKVVLDGMAVVNSLKIADRKAFMAGNILPDFAASKHDAHFYRKADDGGFYLPNLDLAKRMLPSIEDVSLRLGIEGHLYLDERFTRGFLMEKFPYDARTGLVRSRETGVAWTIDEFLSKRALYHGYGEFNALLIRDGKVSMDWIYDNVPAVLPETGVTIFDARKAQDWQSELKWCLENPPTYTGKILKYGELEDFIERCAVEFSLEKHSI